MTPQRRTDDRLTAELVGSCRAHFRSGLDVDAIAKLTGLDTEVVQRIHDVHMDRVRPQAMPLTFRRSRHRWTGILQQERPRNVIHWRTSHR